MPDFDVNAWLRRIGHDGPRDPSLATLRALIAAHSAAIPFENIDVLLGRPPKLDLASLAGKLVADGRGGYCFELNALLRAGLTALGFQVAGLLGRVIRGMAPDAQRPATHMALRVDLPEGSFLADVGFGNQTPTTALRFRAHEAQVTPHETMRLLPVEDEFAVQVLLGGAWESLYRLSPRPALNADYEVANWFAATHPDSPFVSHLIAARPGPDGVRLTLFNSRMTTRRPPDGLDRVALDDAAMVHAALTGTFGLRLAAADLTAALDVLDRKGTRHATHPFFI